MAIAWSLTNRIFFATALTAILSIGLAMSVVNVTVTRQAEDELQRGLEEAATLVEHQRDLLFEQFAREARLIADLPKLKAAVVVDHPPTVQPIAEDYQQQIGSDVFVVTNARGGVLAQIGQTDLPAGRIAALPPVRAALAGRATASFWPRDGGDLQVVTIPIWIDPAQPELLGTLSVGFSLDHRLAARFKELTASEIAFLVGETVQATTIAAEHVAGVASWLRSGGGAPFKLGDEEYVAVTRTLSMEGDAWAWSAINADAAELPIAVVLRSRTRQLEFLRSLQTALAGTALLGVLVATLLSYAVARTVTRPVGAIIATMREMADTGDLTKKITLPGRGRWHDEETQLLATNFNTMTGSIARFQREEAQRERLSSLGRLSTIVAHEIRNPLMIIKTALRTLTRQGALAPPVTAAAQDIGEEVDRLNRIVGEVLDFARPIRFVVAPVDLNALCSDAIAAAEGDAHRPAIRTVFDPAAGDIVTDGERLRLTLVNLLTNALHAVVERKRRQYPGRPDPSGERAEADADIEVSTASLGDAAVEVRVRDRGVGIAPSDLPSVFDPYFTTKRAGSGLGLAIAKNVIEGLGGTITASSRVGEGTEMRIEIPRYAAAAGRQP